MLFFDLKVTYSLIFGQIDLLQASGIQSSINSLKTGIEHRLITDVEVFISSSSKHVHRHRCCQLIGAFRSAVTIEDGKEGQFGGHRRD